MFFFLGDRGVPFNLYFVWGVRGLSVFHRRCPVSQALPL